jgi:predicted GNAT family acetyltransferase
MKPEIKHKENDTRGIFYMKKDDKTFAELTYNLENDVMTIDHTEVRPDLEGNGYATQLTEEIVAFAKAKHRKINPLCPFAEVLFDRREEWNDLRVSD